MYETSMKNIDLNLDSNITKPYVSFQYHVPERDYWMDNYTNMKKHINKVVVHCKPEDFSSDINIDKIK